MIVFWWLVVGCSGNIEENSDIENPIKETVVDEQKSEKTAESEHRPPSKIIEYEVFFTDVQNVLKF